MRLTFAQVKILLVLPISTLESTITRRHWTHLVSQHTTEWPTLAAKSKQHLLSDCTLVEKVKVRWPCSWTLFSVWFVHNDMQWFDLMLCDPVLSCLELSVQFLPPFGGLGTLIRNIGLSLPAPGSQFWNLIAVWFGLLWTGVPAALIIDQCVWKLWNGPDSGPPGSHEVSCILETFGSKHWTGMFGLKSVWIYSFPWSVVTIDVRWLWLQKWTITWIESGRLLLPSCLLLLLLPTVAKAVLPPASWLSLAVTSMQPAQSEIGTNQGQCLGESNGVWGPWFWSDTGCLYNTLW